MLGIPGRALAGVNPTVTGITPAQGSARGGTFATITGADFQSGVRVYIGSLPLESVTRVSSTQITGTTAQSDGGAGRSATVLVVNPDGSAGSLTSAFFFVTSDTPLAISSVAPSTGTNSGGTNLTIVGGGFNG
ncbi:MAG: IPT/TIG domain-containing protein, partial [Chloroflexota bacterium]